MVTDKRVQANLRVGLVLKVLDTLAEEVKPRNIRQFEPDAPIVIAAVVTAARLELYRQEDSELC